MITIHYYQVGLCCKLAGPWTYGRYILVPYVQLINCRLHLFRSSPSSFSSKYLSVSQIIKKLCCSSTSVIWHHEGGNFFSQYNKSNRLFYVGYYLEASSSLLFAQELIYYLLCGCTCQRMKYMKIECCTVHFRWELVQSVVFRIVK